MDLPEAEPPTDVVLDRSSGLTLRWPDGAESHYELDELRVNCPCAECRGIREQGGTPGPGPLAPTPLQALGAELVGAWGISIQWNDGHATGIYAWSMLKLWKIIPHSWMTKPCNGTCGSDDPHSHDTTVWFRLAYGSAKR